MSPKKATMANAVQTAKYAATKSTNAAGKAGAFDAVTEYIRMKPSDEGNIIAAVITSHDAKTATSANQYGRATAYNA
jgi:hypothetical protein